MTALNCPDAKVSSISKIGVFFESILENITIIVHSPLSGARSFVKNEGQQGAPAALRWTEHTSASLTLHNTKSNNLKALKSELKR